MPGEHEYISPHDASKPRADDNDRPRLAPSFPSYRSSDRAARNDSHPQDEAYDGPREAKQGFEDNLWLVTKHIERRRARLDKLDVTPSPEVVRKVVAAIPNALPDDGDLGDTMQYLMQRFLPGCLPAQNGPRYFGFVTGGTTDAAQLADMLVTSYDENVQVTLPDTTASTALEGRALEWVLDLLGIARDVFVGRTITTGATASNVLGLACAREALYAAASNTPDNYSFAEHGPPARGHQDPPIVIVALEPHFSIRKAAALVGIGSRSFVAVKASASNPLAFDLDDLVRLLDRPKDDPTKTIVSYGLGEVNTGGFGRDLRKVATLCQKYGAWLHVDAAFGGFAHCVPELRHLTDGIELANSLTLDGHKWLNIPYDCGLFFTSTSQNLKAFLGPPEDLRPAYLSSGPEDIPSPLYVGIENSRRFRALPLFASLMTYGWKGYRHFVRMNVHFARQLAELINVHPSYELLNRQPGYTDRAVPIIPLNIVLFRGSESSVFHSPDNDNGIVKLIDALNGSRKLYVSGTRYRNRGAIRIAISNWLTWREEDFNIVKGVLEEVAGITVVPSTPSPPRGY
ncbi:hypothetical protein VHUM_04232 [Vanrija humicola]|uniref:Aminotransferase class V domain-containing protein n=1 Tax=Vanrija humicola TaxID=5417 RepID=A0A7D8UYA9_VANHU|nr:hypothetical protein VHUM_04232 [Vanrija humicola]